MRVYKGERRVSLDFFPSPSGAGGGYGLGMKEGEAGAGAVSPLLDLVFLLYVHAMNDGWLSRGLASWALGVSCKSGCILLLPLCIPPPCTPLCPQGKRV